ISKAARGILERSSGREICTYAPADLTSRPSDTGVPRSETFAENGLPLTIVSNSRINGWNNMAEWLTTENRAEPRLRIFSNCRELIDCIPKLQHDPKKVEDCATEPHNITHAPDALRYLLDGRPMPAEIAEPEPQPIWMRHASIDSQEADFLSYGQ
ncbi:MAG: hypothetical protein II025_02865, partial [Ruminococcus sp.]|nr:hypothetical protein [Ruminococcus sp.]